MARRPRPTSRITRRGPRAAGASSSPRTTRSTPAPKAFVGIAGLWDDSQIAGHAELTRRVHKHGAAIFAQIYHAGRQAARRFTGVEAVAPTAIPCPFTLETPHALTVEEIATIVEQFGDCALRAKKAGFDGVEVHGGHGYLIAQFMSSYSNKRFDKYGGNLVNRMRLPLEIIANIRKKCGDDFPIQFRISADEMVPGGRTIEDTKAQVRMLGTGRSRQLRRLGRHRRQSPGHGDAPAPWRTAGSRTTRRRSRAS